ncbi:MAG: response regulator [Gammaproteobacteria bacterium]|nr:response regulator [Gammaproteobacteria bacterium]
MLKVILVDDHQLVRTGVRRLLEDTKEVKVIAEADSGEQGIQLTVEHNPDLVMMDINMPGIGGIEASHRIIQRNKNQKIIILTVHTEQSFPKRLLEIGAKGYLTKECGIDEMLKAMKQVNDGGSYISPEIAQQLALSLIPGLDQNPVDTLSRREFQVMLMISQGLHNNEISERLCLSPKTISTYRTRLFEKLGAKSEVDLIKIAASQGLLDLTQQDI